MNPTHWHKPDLELSEDIATFESTLIPLQSLTAILPVVPRSLNRTPEILLPFLKPSKFIREIILVCPESIATPVRQMLQRTLVSIGTTDHPDVSLYPWIGHLDPAIGVLKTISEVSTVWVLLMDDQGLSKVVDSIRSLLLHPPQFPVPFGPIGVLQSSPASNVIHHLGRSRLATYLCPPFVMPASLGTFPINIQHNGIEPWVNLGSQVSKHRPDAIGGIIVLDEDFDNFTHSAVNHKLAATHENLPPWNITSSGAKPPTFPSPVEASKRHGTFVFFFLVLDDLRDAAHLICRIQTKNKINIRIFVYGEYAQTKVKVDWVTGYLETERCTLIYEVLVTGVTLSFSRARNDILSRWFDTFDNPPDVIVARKELDHLVGYLLSNHQDILLWDATLIQIPRLDLKYTEWMSSLTLVEWKSVVNSRFFLFTLIVRYRLAPTSHRHQHYNQRSPSLSHTPSGIAFDCEIFWRPPRSQSERRAGLRCSVIKDCRSDSLVAWSCFYTSPNNSWGASSSRCRILVSSHQ